jgi:ADP-ribosyl-[dinitrogen reductase] hydrolase
MNFSSKNPIRDALLGVAVGDALGVPFEFKSQGQMHFSPATDMIGYGTHNQPPGTWSDDTSLTLCLADALCEGFDLATMARYFILWRREAFWTAHFQLFDIGITTREAISRLDGLLLAGKKEELPFLKYGGDERDNGNGSLMRILPLLFYIENQPITQQFETVWQVSALTHRHIRAAMACMIYLKLAEHLLHGKEKIAAYLATQTEILALWQEINFAAEEQALFQRVIQNDIRTVDVMSLRSGGYVMESIETALYCFLQKEDYASTCLAAVNFGHDTDTTAAIAGGLAGLYYTTEGIPPAWLMLLAREKDITKLAERLQKKWEGEYRLGE